MFQALRLQNLIPPQLNITPFDPTQFGPGIDLSQIPMQPRPSIYDLFKPQHDAEDRFDRFIQSFPQPDKPSLMQRITGAFVGAAKGPEAALQYNYTPYLQKMGDYMNQAKLLGQSADDESKDNSTNLLRLIQQEQQDTRQQTADQNAVYNQRRADTADYNASTSRARADVAAARATAYQYKMMHPNWISKTADDGTLIYFNPQNPNEFIRTGVKTNELTVDDRKMLIQEQGAQNRETKQTEGAPVTTISQTTSTGATTPTQESIAQYNQAKQALRDHPEWANYINIDDVHKTFSIDPPSNWMPGRPLPQVYDQIAQYINQAKATPTPVTRTTTTTRGPSTTNPANPITSSSTKIPPIVQKAITTFNKALIKPGYVGLVDKDGNQIGQVPASQATIAAKQGYFVVSK